MRDDLARRGRLPVERIDVEADGDVAERRRHARRVQLVAPVGIGIALFSLVSDMGWSGGWDNDFDSGLLGIATIPATIGVAFIILSFFNKNRD